MEIVSSIVKAQLNRFIIEMGDSAMKKKTIIISGIAAVLVIGSVVFCFAVKGDGTQPAEVAQTVTEAVATPTIEVTQETTEEVSEPEEAEEVPEVEVVEEPEVIEEAPVVEETSSEGSIVDVAETSEEVSEGSGVDTKDKETSNEVSQVAEPKQEEVKPAETKPVETQPQQTKTEPNVNQISTDEASQALINQILADGGSWGIPSSTSTLGECPSVGGASLNIIVE